MKFYIISKSIMQDLNIVRLELFFCDYISWFVCWSLYSSYIIYTRQIQ